MSNLLDISDILVTQSNLRDRDQLKEMIKFVSKGGVFDELALGSFAIRQGLTRVSPVVEIARFEDGVMAIHNGHHRAVSIFLGRNTRKIKPNEYFIREWKYSDYTDIVLPHWVTPFDINKEFRLPELGPWKKEVHKFYILHGETETRRFILENKNKYASDRYFYTVGDMVSRLNLYKYKE